MIKIGIITNDNPRTDRSIRILAEMAPNFNSKVVILKPSLTGKSPSVDIIYPRISPDTSEKRFLKYLNFYKKLAAENSVPFINAPENLAVAYDKYKMVELVEKMVKNVVPKTKLVEKKADLRSFSDEFGFPLVVKELHGYGGAGVYLAKDFEGLSALIKPRKKYVLQEFIELEQIRDYRVYVVNNEVAGGLVRTNDRKGEFRSNTFQGAKAEFFNPGAELSKLAISIAAKTGNEIVAIDFIKKDKKYYFIEFNHAFSVKAENEPKKLAVVKKILEFCTKKATDQAKAKS